MIFFLQGDLGDQITMLPAVKAFYRQYKRRDCGQAYIIADPCVKELIPAYPWLLDERDMLQESYQNAIALNVWRAVERFGKEIHPVRMFFRYLGIDEPLEADPYPEIRVDEDAPAYDYVIAPFANDPARAMPHELIRSFIHDGLHWCVGGGSLVVVGGDEDELRRVYLESGDYSFAWQKTLHAEFGCPLSYVAGLMRNARKAVITVDSLANRLAHAVAPTNHVLLCSDVVPEVWATHPRVKSVLYGPPESWKTETIMGALGR